MNLGNKLDSSIFQDSVGASTPQGEHATTSEREKPKSKTKIQRFMAWVTKHEMTFDILEALQLAGQLPIFVLFLAVQNSSIGDLVTESVTFDFDITE